MSTANSARFFRHFGLGLALIGFGEFAYRYLALEVVAITLRIWAPSTWETPMYGYLVIAMVFTVVLGVPAVVWLTKLIRPPKAAEEAIHRGVEEAGAQAH